MTNNQQHLLLSTQNKQLATELFDELKKFGNLHEFSQHSYAGFSSTIYTVIAVPKPEQIHASFLASELAMLLSFTNGYSKAYFAHHI